MKLNPLLHARLQEAVRALHVDAYFIAQNARYLEREDRLHCWFVPRSASAHLLVFVVNVLMSSRLTGISRVLYVCDDDVTACKARNFVCMLLPHDIYVPGKALTICTRKTLPLSTHADPYDAVILDNVRPVPIAGDPCEALRLHVERAKCIRYAGHELQPFELYRRVCAIFPGSFADYYNRPARV